MRVGLCSGLPPRLRGRALRCLTPESRMMSAQDNMLQELQGDVVLVPGETGKRCGGAKVALVTDSGDEYVIIPKGAGADLAGYLSARISALAVIEERDEELYCIQVRSYRLADDFVDA